MQNSLLFKNDDSIQDGYGSRILKFSTLPFFSRIKFRKKEEGKKKRVDESSSILSCSIFWMNQESSAIPFLMHLNDMNKFHTNQVEKHQLFYLNFFRSEDFRSISKSIQQYQCFPASRNKHNLPQEALQCVEVKTKYTDECIKSYTHYMHQRVFK